MFSPPWLYNDCKSGVGVFSFKFCNGANEKHVFRVIFQTDHPVFVVALHKSQDIFDFHLPPISPRMLDRSCFCIFGNPLEGGG